jgi:ABC-type Na+ efflux pump permease subunit
MLRRILLIARRDYVAVVRTKAFIIGLVAFPILFGGGTVAAALMQNRGGTKRVVILDRTGISAPRIIQAAKDKREHGTLNRNTGFQLTPQFEFETVVSDDTHTWPSNG